MNDSISKRVWLHLLRQGGRWSCAEIAAANEGVRESSIATLASRLSTSGVIRRYEKSGAGDRVRYGVTKECSIPLGVTLSELMEVGVVKEPS